MVNLKPRKADEIIGENYLSRWHLRRKHGSWNLYLHRYDGSDDDRALHDHPWKSISILLWGNLVEETAKGKKRIWPFLTKYRSAEYAHTIHLEGKRAYTLFLTFRKERDWGFHCPQGWVPWQKFTDSSGKLTGKGCDD